MNLTKEQLERLKSFIRQRGFTEIDLQYEILDQMAGKVEKILSDNSSLKFDSAVNQAHREFGVHGFAVLEDAARKELTKDYWQQIKMEWSNWLGLPVSLLGSCFLLAYIYRVAAPLWVLICLLTVFVSTHIYLLFKFRKPLRRYRHTLINKVQTAFTVVFPLIFLQLLTRIILHADVIIGVLEQTFWSIGFAVSTLFYLFMLCAMARVMRYSIARAQLFEQKYGDIR